MAKENERKEAKERKRKQDGGLLINPLGNTARAREGAHAHASGGVLGGKRWGEMGMPKRTFNWKIKKVCSLIAHPLQNPSL